MPVKVGESEPGALPGMVPPGAVACLPVLVRSIVRGHLTVRAPAARLTPA
ncbi:hypothetical protein GCM10010116_03290 [Microbispora rosea subsp. aerata]|nr:hypothetical protein [Microbispora rosea]GGO01766.1 hypothetical protein GCM10010116_03290 [Microbispora rosea subsp. aerata]